MTHLTLTRAPILPATRTLELFRRAPECGPRVLFFSGGTGPGPLATALTRYTHNTRHIITPFDSGGSSAALRRAFGMPAVGDIRSRIMALADMRAEGTPGVAALFALRLPMDVKPAELKRELAAMAAGRHPKLRPIMEPLRQIVVRHLAGFMAAMPPDLDLAGASIGNLILTAGYLDYNRQLEPVTYLFSKLVQARGQVYPVVDDDAHLCVRLKNGEVIVGQHRFTGKSAPPLTSPVVDLSLVAGLDEPVPVTVRIRPRMRERIKSADLICYPVGSFFSSVLANLLPQGVGRAVIEARCPKVFIPNAQPDPELVGQSVRDQVAWIVEKVGGAPGEALHVLLADPDESRYPGGIPHRWLKARGIQVLTTPLLDDTTGRLDPEKACAALLALC